MHEISSHAFPSYRREYNLDLQIFIEKTILPERLEILKKILDKRTQFVGFVAENLVDNHNVNAMLRTSEAFGWQNFYNIVHSEPLKKSKMVSKGSFQWTKIHNFSGENRVEECIQFLKANGYKIAVSHVPQNAISPPPPSDLDVSSPVVLWFGSEHDGVSETALQHADFLFEIPMYGFTESFNVSVAAAIAGSAVNEKVRKSHADILLTEAEKQQLYFEWLWYSVRNPDTIFQAWEKL